MRMLSFEVLYESFAGVAFTIVFCATVSILDDFRAQGDNSGLVGVDYTSAQHLMVERHCAILVFLFSALGTTDLVGRKLPCTI